MNDVTVIITEYYSNYHWIATEGKCYISLVVYMDLSAVVMCLLLSLFTLQYFTFKYIFNSFIWKWHESGDMLG
jgi:hypothetical protein